MYETFSVKNFRCFEDLTLKSLKRVNLIAGENNVGKTTLLEAICLLAKAGKSDTPFLLADGAGTPVREVFFFTPRVPKELLETNNVKFLSKAIVENKDDEVASDAMLLEPRLKKLAVVSPTQLPTIYGDIGLDRKIPISLLGEGFSRWLSIVLNARAVKNGVMLLDEFENGFYHAKLPQLWSALGAAAKKFDFQVFATTHSYECVASAQEAFSQSDDFGYYRLDRLKPNDRRKPEEKDIVVTEYDKETLKAAVEMHHEVR